MFLGVDEFSHAPALTGASSQTTKKSAFLARMQLYMPRHHRNFLNHLAVNPRPLRAIVANASVGDGDSQPQPQLLEAYNAAVGALKRFRDYHITIVTSYIIQPARRAARETAMRTDSETAGEGAAAVEEVGEQTPLRGTGGTELAKFLKAVRDRTAAAVMES
jgi:indoleamine 2,3-dioxygenase